MLSAALIFLLIFISQAEAILTTKYAVVLSNTVKKNYINTIQKH